MEHFSCKDKCGVHGCHTHIKTFKRRAGLGYRLILKTVIPLSKQDAQAPLEPLHFHVH